MRRWTTAIAVAAGTALIAITAAPAQALYVRPSSALMRDASGTTNGCVAEVPAMSVSDGSIIIPIQVTTCPDGSNVLRLTFRAAVYEVMKDKSLRTVISNDKYLVSSSPQPVIGPDLLNLFLPCSDAGVGGTHTWLVRARLGAKQTLNNSDPNPFVAKVDRKQTVTCA